jgi:hypothetical protein
MGHVWTFQRQRRFLFKRRRFLFKCHAATATIFLFASVCRAQAPAAPPNPSPWTQEVNKYPGLLPELGRLLDKLRQNLQFPPPRTESRLLPLLPESTMSYAAFSNYGDAIHQALHIFHQELQDSPVLRDWWQHGQLASSGPKFEDSLEKFSQLHQFLGDEIVVAAVVDAKSPSFIMIAEVRKPGLKLALQQWIAQVADKSKPGIRVLDQQELATAVENRPANELLVVVRPDFVVAGSDLATLRGFNTHLVAKSREFPSTPFGQRVAHEYGNGVTILAAADLQKILNQVPRDTKQNLTLQSSGFADVQYLTWERTTVAGQLVSRAELSFTSPRHGIASWLAPPAPLGSLDFVSPKTIVAATIILESPAQIFEDAKKLGGPSNANSFAALAQGEQALKLSLKEDLLRHLSGEITLELDSLTVPQVWKTILKVDDPAHIQQTLGTLLTVAHFDAGQVSDGEITYYTVRVPSGKTTTEITYAFADGYLIVGSSHAAVAEAVELHASGAGLGKSRKFLAALPPGHSSEASALIYEDPSAVAAMQLQRLAPGLAEAFARPSQENPPQVLGVYAGESAIREESVGGALDFGGVLVGAAIAIPNLLRSRMAANEASAAGSVRTVIVAEVTYSAAYPKRGYAPDLLTLGPDPRGTKIVSADHAGLVSDTLANATCAADGWCTTSGFHVRVAALCKQHLCDDYVAVATPVDSNTGARSFCSTSDGVVRFKPGPPLTSPPTVPECNAWQKLQ